MCLPGSNVGKDGDHAETAAGKDRKDLVIISGVKIDTAVCKTHHFDGLADVSRCVLDTDDVWYFPAQLYSGGRKNVAACAARDIVENNRDTDSICNCRVMLNKTLLCCFIVVGRYEQKTVSACFLSFF